MAPVPTAWIATRPARLAISAARRSPMNVGSFRMHRMTCQHCHTSAVFTPDVAGALYEQMKEVVFNQLGFELNIPTGLALVDRNQLKEVIRLQTDEKQEQAAGHQDLDPERTLGVYARRGMRRGIYIQTGLPRMLFLQVAAHEYAHAWQGENCPILRDKTRP